MDKYQAGASPHGEVPADDPLGDLGALSLTIGRLRRFLTEPPSPAEEAEAHRRADGIADWARHRS